MTIGLVSLVGPTVAYLKTHLRRQGVRSASVAISAPSGRTVTAENRAVPVEIIARGVVTRQGRTGLGSAFSQSHRFVRAGRGLVATKGAGRGTGPAASRLLRPTTPLEPEVEQQDDQVEGQVGSAEVKPRVRPRRKRPAVASKTSGRKLILPDDVHDRLWLLARQRRQTISAVAAEILDRNLPRFSVTRDG
jgi:hypothetical protein